MPDLKKRLAKKKLKAEAKAERKNIKSKGKNQDAVNKGYQSQASKNKATTESVVKVRKAKVKKGPKTVTTSYKEGDKTNIVKNKTTVTSSGATAQSASVAQQKQKQNQSSNSSSKSKAKAKTPVKKKVTPKPTPNRPKIGGEYDKPGRKTGPKRDRKSWIENEQDLIKKRRKREENTFSKRTMKTGGVVNPNMRSMSVDAEKAYKSNAKRRNMPKGY